MPLNTFSILKKQGEKFSKISGDYNKIHIDEKTGYNSIFGNPIFACKLYPDPGI